jgi:drug/metabolite transporter (DMT)-like permease
MVSTATPPSRALVAPNLVCMASMLIWAAALPAADVLIPNVPPLPLTAARMVLAGLFLLPIWWAIEGLAVLRRAAWVRGTLIGALIATGAFCLVVGQAMTDAVTVAIVAASMPVLGIALEVAFDGRRLTAGVVIGVMLSLLGGLLALSGKPLGVELGLGAGLSLVSVFLFTLGSRFSVTALPGTTPLARTTITLCGAGLASGLMALAAWAVGSAGPNWAALGWADLGALLMFSVAGLGISQLLWIMSIGSLGIGLAALHINATPFYVMMILFALGGQWDWYQALGALVVGLGVLVAQGLLHLPRQGR